MFAIAFDLDTIETEQEHPSGVSQAYRDIANGRSAGSASGECRAAFT